jgi:cation diffusion facilitator CzcD-associated flavoprotein CzcO
MTTVHDSFFPTPVITSSQLKGRLPNVTIDETVDCIAIATSCIACLENLQQSDLTVDALWRDSLSITEHQRTLSSAATIFVSWSELALKCKPHNFRLVPDTAQIIRLGPQPSWLTARFLFETAGDHAAECSGMLNMVPDDSGDYKIWTFCTLMEALKTGGMSGNPDSFPDPTFAPAAGLEDGGEIDCIIVGGGMGGLCVAGRLHALRVPYLVVERNPSVGDNWTKRYDSIQLHLSNSYSEMPFQRVYTDRPYNLSSHDLAAGMQNYVDMHNIQVWLSSSLDKAQWDDELRSWTVTVRKQGQSKTLRVKHLVMAIGGGIDEPRYPSYANRDKYQGMVLHSIDWKNANAFEGKNAIIIGSGNSALDIAQNMVDSKLSRITLIQRSVTHVMSSTVVYPLQDRLYNPGADLKISDRMTMSPPYAVGRLMIMAGATALQAQDATRYDFLTKAGFRFHQDPDLYSSPIERFGGHLLDHGALSVIESGKVKVKSGVLPTEYSSTGLYFQDGTHIDADVVVLATGFRNNLRQSVTAIVGNDTAAQLDDFFGLDVEGEIRGLARPIGREFTPSPSLSPSLSLSTIHTLWP